jgi:hypothetical protein
VAKRRHAERFFMDFVYLDRSFVKQQDGFFSPMPLAYAW